MIDTTHRLRVVRAYNWKGEPGYRWVCDDLEAIKAHPKGVPHTGFSNEVGFTASVNAHHPPALSRAMDGARIHLIRYHLEVS